MPGLLAKVSPTDWHPLPPMRQRTRKSEICQDCQKWQRAYQGKILLNHAAYDYNAAFHDLMVSYKRYGDYILCQLLSELAKEDLVKLQFDYYVPVPTNPDHQQSGVTILFGRFLTP